RRLPRFGPHAFHQYQAREQVADLVGQFGMALDVLSKCRPFAAPVALDEFLGKPVERIDLGAGFGHGYVLRCVDNPSAQLGDYNALLRHRASSLARHPTAHDVERDAPRACLAQALLRSDRSAILPGLLAMRG